MQVKLRVLEGSNEGREINIGVPEFVVGRADGCQLRPRSDTVSRRHCALLIQDGQVFVRDLGSRNGTLVNGETITEDTAVQTGDVLKIGKLQFEVMINRGAASPKRPKVHDIKEAAARTVSGGLEDDDISDWLEEADEVDRERRLTDPETRQFKLDETERIALEKASQEQAEETQDEKDSDKKKKKPEKKEYGKLPKPPEQESKDSREAASNMLKKFFNRR